MIKVYTMSIKGLKKELTTVNVKEEWKYLIAHYDKLENYGIRDKLDNFNTIVLNYLCLKMNKKLLGNQYRRIDNINTLSYATESVNKTTTKVITETVFDKLAELPSFVSDQVIESVLEYLGKLDIGLSYTCEELEE